jgi:hypothetical protein
MPALSSSGHTSIIVIVVIVTALIAGGLGYFLGNRNLPRTNPVPMSVNPAVEQQNAGKSNTIATQTATAVGKVVKIENNSVTLQGDDGIITGFKLGQKINIYNTSAASSSGVPKVSQNPKDIVLNQKYILSLQLLNGSYFITAMNLVPQTK